jgi:hypothetical protein
VWIRSSEGLRKLQRTEEALEVYRELAMLAGTVVGGSPAELVASRERMVLFRKAGDEEGVTRETACGGFPSTAAHHRRFASRFAGDETSTR